MPGDKTDATKKAPKAATKKATPFQEKSAVFEKEWMVEKALDSNSIFGAAFLMAHVDAKTNKQVEKQKLLMKEYITNSEADAKAHSDIMNQRMALDHAHLMRLHDWSAHKKSDWCSSFYKFKAFYTMPESNMRLRLQQLADKAMPHDELTHIMYQMLFALDYLHSDNHPFNDVRPEYVGKLAPEHSWMLCDRLNAKRSAIGAQGDNFTEIWGHKASRRFYASPEVFAIVAGPQKKGTKVPKVDEKRADVWSYGMMLLSAGLGLTVKDHNKVYVAGANPHMDFAMLDNWIVQFKQRYEQDSNSILGMVVEECLRHQPEERPTTSDLLNHHLPNYEEVCNHLGGHAHDQDVQGDNRPHHDTVVAGGAKPVHHVVEHPVEVYHPAPVVSHQECHPTTSTVEVREGRTIHETAQPEVRVIKREPEVRREYVKLDGTRTSHAHEAVHCHEPVVHSEGVVHHDNVIRRSRVVAHDSHREANVVRSSHRGETRVIRGEPRVIRGDSRVVHHDVSAHHEHAVQHHAPVHHEHVVHSDAVHTDNVIRRSRVVHQPISEVVNHGDHHHHVVSSGHHHHNAMENVRVIKDPAEVAAYKEKMMAEGRVFETKRPEEHTH